MSIVIIKPGILDTIQDLGRNGQGSFGINPGGAMDRLAARLANVLTGNHLNEAVIEIHYPGPQILFEQDALITITGADFTAGLNDEPLPLWKPVLIRKNTVLQFPVLKKGARAYLAVHGGFCVEHWLNSYSTNLKAGIGGWKGRRLEKGDELFFRESNCRIADLFKSENNFQLLPWSVNPYSFYKDLHEVLFIPGHEWNELTSKSKHDLSSSTYTIHPSSDRMGYQLRGNLLHLEQKKEMVSCAVSFGTIQLLPNGQLVILMADHQTSGGYPRIGHIISPHLPKLAQLNPGDSLQFRPIDIITAESFLLSQHNELQILYRACEDRLKKLYADCRP
ncbi:MAG: biotin-dependent carboxyltransferase family protein [Chitinophagaceae bacterium]